MSRPLGVALLGCGVVGTQVARLLVEQQTELAARVGAPLPLRGVAVRRAGRTRGVDVDPALFTTDAAELVRRDDVDLVVEVIGGIEPARSLILDALEHGASVVTANKALLAEDGATLSTAAQKAGRDLFFEASVAGAIPILRPLAESLAGDRVNRVLGIVNGTTNFILDRMTTQRRRASPRRWRRRRRSATPRPTRRPTSRASTPRPRRRSSPPSPSTPG